MLAWLPDDIAPQGAVVLIVIDFLTWAISAAFGLGGGGAKLIELRHHIIGIR